MITTDIPPVHRRSPAKKVTGRGARKGYRSAAVAIEPAHLLFPPDQAFLWLPGLPGDQVAYCTYNESRGNPESTESRGMSRMPDRDENQALFAPPYRVSTATYIAWHTDVTPPFPFHPVPIARSLSAAELKTLGRRVLALANHNTDQHVDPLQFLRNNCKCLVFAALSEMGFLAGLVPRPC